MGPLPCESMRRKQQESLDSGARRTPGTRQASTPVDVQWETSAYALRGIRTATTTFVEMTSPLALTAAPDNQPTPTLRHAARASRSEG